MARGRLAGLRRGVSDHLTRVNDSPESPLGTIKHVGLVLIPFYGEALVFNGFNGDNTERVFGGLILGLKYTLFYCAAGGILEASNGLY